MSRASRSLKYCLLATSVTYFRNEGLGQSEASMQIRVQWHVEAEIMAVQKCSRKEKAAHLLNYFKMPDVAMFLNYVPFKFRVVPLWIHFRIAKSIPPQWQKIFSFTKKWTNSEELVNRLFTKSSSHWCKSTWTLTIRS